MNTISMYGYAQAESQSTNLVLVGSRVLKGTTQIESRIFFVNTIIYFHSVFTDLRLPIIFDHRFG